MSSCNSLSSSKALVLTEADNRCCLSVRIGESNALTKISRNLLARNSSSGERQNFLGLRILFLRICDTRNTALACNELWHVGHNGICRLSVPPRDCGTVWCECITLSKQVHIRHGELGSAGADTEVF